MALLSVNGTWLVLISADGGDAQARFETQFFHDDGDGDEGGDFGFGADSPLGGGGIPSFDEEDDLWAGTQGQQLKRTRPENVHFAKKAKRVDVKRLKDDIWSGLKSLVPESDPEKEGTSEEVSPFLPSGCDNRHRRPGCEVENLMLTSVGGTDDACGGS